MNVETWNTQNTRRVWPLPAEDFVGDIFVIRPVIERTNAS